MLGTVAAATTSSTPAIGSGSPTGNVMYYGSGLAELDQSTYPICDAKITADYGQPASLEFTMFTAQHTLPIPRHTYVRFVDNIYGGSASPVFEGYVSRIIPTSTNQVRYICYDPTWLAAQDVFVFSSLTAAIPRLLYNERIDTSQDYAFQRRTDATTAEMLTDILDDATASLQAINAAPDSGTPYNPNDFATWTYKPQDRVEFVGTTMRDAIGQLLDLERKHRLIFEMGPSSRKWRLHDVTAAEEITLTLNDFSGSQQVFSLDLSHNTEKRYTAIKIYGPEGSTNTSVTQTSGLTKLWTPTEETFLIASGPGAVGSHVGAHWQITDADKRRMAKLLPEEIVVESGGITASGTSGAVGLSFTRTRRPQLIASWDSGTTWEPVVGWDADWQLGIIRAPYPVYKEIDSVRTMPDEVKLYYAYASAPLSVRYPTSGYSGTAYTVANIESEWAIPDEMLAVGYERGTPVTNTVRQAQYAILAQTMQEAHRDIVYTGGCTLKGLQYAWLKLGRRVHIAAVDAEGTPITTGWEAIGAWVTGCELDYSVPGGLTTLTFSNDLAETETDIDGLRERLKIRPYETAIVGGHKIIPVYNPRTKTTTVSLVNEQQFVHYEVPQAQQTVF